MVEIFIERDNKTKKLKLENPVAMKLLLKKLDISVESVILVKNNDICLEDELISDKDKVKLLSVVSGG